MELSKNGSQNLGNDLMADSVQIPTGATVCRRCNSDIFFPSHLLQLIGWLSSNPLHPFIVLPAPGAVPWPASPSVCPTVIRYHLRWPLCGTPTSSLSAGLSRASLGSCQAAPLHLTPPPYIARSLADNSSSSSSSFRELKPCPCSLLFVFDGA